MLCLGILAMWCFPPGGENKSAVDSYCSAYVRVIKDPGDGQSVAGTKVGVQQRVARNDSLYRCTCEGWKNPICEKIRK